MNIKFFCDEHLLGAIPSPVPAVKAIPDYFRQIKPQTDNHPKNTTVKSCVPFLEALSAGFVIRMWCDVYVVANNGDITLDFPPDFHQIETLGSHSPAQIPKHPMANRPYGNMPMKWVNPWVIETEPGVSCIFTSPLNHMETRFKLLDGVVDTDNYYNNINLPFLWTGGDGEFLIKRGTPLVQVIPFRREEMGIEVLPLDESKITATRALLGTRFRDKYREGMWHGRRNKDPISDEAVVATSRSEPEVYQHIATETSEQQTGHLSPSDALHSNGYVVLDSLVTHGEAHALTEAIRNHIIQTGARPDQLCPNSSAVHGMPETDALLERLTPVVSEAAGRNLIPTYSYARMYVNGETLPKHTDRPACQYSVTLCLGMDGKPWPIYMAKTEDEEGAEVCLGVGDSVLYLGMDMVHYRNAFDGEWQAQVFLHWVDADGPHVDQKYDGRAALSHHNHDAMIVSDPPMDSGYVNDWPSASIVEVDFNE